MAENLIGIGISYIDIPNFHIVRIVVRNARDDFQNTFVLGSILGSSSQAKPSLVAGRSIKSQVGLIEKGIYTLRPTIAGQKLTLLPMWLSNGIFFGPEKLSLVMGPVVQNKPDYKGVPSRLYNYPRYLYSTTPAANKIKRWMYLHNLIDEENVNFSFQRLNADTTASAIAANWGWAMGGAGILVENGKPHATETYWNKEATGNFSRGQWYSTGPIIAENNSEANKVLYLIMNTQSPRSDHKCDATTFCWHQAAQYLTTSFLCYGVSVGFFCRRYFVAERGSTLSRMGSSVVVISPLVPQLFCRAFLSPLSRFSWREYSVAVGFVCRYRFVALVQRFCRVRWSPLLRRFRHCVSVVSMGLLRSGRVCSGESFVAGQVV